MRGLHLLLVLLALPALAALGHDVWLYSQEPDKGFMLSALGYLWTHYDPDSYEWTVKNTEPEVWAWIDYILAQKSVIVGAAFGGFFYLIVLTLKLVSLTGSKTVSASGDILGTGKNKSVKYKRK